MIKYKYKMIYACNKDEESRVQDTDEAENTNLVTDFLNEREVINIRKERVLDFEISEV